MGGESAGVSVAVAVWVAVGSAVAGIWVAALELVLVDPGRISVSSPPQASRIIKSSSKTTGVNRVFSGIRRAGAFFCIGEMNRNPGGPV